MEPADSLVLLALIVSSIALVMPPGLFYTRVLVKEKHAMGPQKGGGRMRPETEEEAARRLVILSDGASADIAQHIRWLPVWRFADRVYNGVVVFFSAYVAILCASVSYAASSEKEAESELHTYMVVASVLALVISVASDLYRAEVLVTGVILVYVNHAVAGTVTSPGSVAFTAMLAATSSVWMIVIACVVCMWVRSTVIDSVASHVVVIATCICFAFSATCVSAGGVSVAATRSPSDGSPFSVSFTSAGLMGYGGAGVAVLFISYVARRCSRKRDMDARDAMNRAMMN